MTYNEAIRAGFDYLLKEYPDTLVMGQGLWSPFYVGRSMEGLDDSYGRDRVMDTPVSENAVTGIALGAALAGLRAIVVHPRMDFMILAADQIVNEAAKWRSVLGSGMRIPLTIRGIINRGGEQGAQHSQALHAWFAHVPGLRVVMPATPSDARELLIESALCDDPVLYIDDRWCYDFEEDDSPVELQPLENEGPRVLREGRDITLVGIGFTTHVCDQAATHLAEDGISCEVVDLRVLNPLVTAEINASVARTKRLCVVDGGWKTAGMAGEIVARTVEEGMVDWITNPKRVTLPDAPAPTSRPLEAIYYPTAAHVADVVRAMVQ